MSRQWRLFSLFGLLPQQRRIHRAAFLLSLLPLAHGLSDASAQDAWDRWKQKSAAQTSATKDTDRKAATKSARENSTPVSLSSEATSDFDTFVSNMRDDQRSRSQRVQPTGLKTNGDDALMSVTVSSDMDEAAKVASVAEETSSIWWSNEVQKPLRPDTNSVPVTMESLLVQSLDQIRAACIRLRMSKIEMLPVLNVVTETYVAGLQDNASVGDA